MIILPVEVLNLIFSQIVARDKLECMTVCRQWHDTIQQHFLFRVIYIHHQRQLKHLIEKVGEQPSLGTNVKQIAIEFKPDWNFDATVFVKLFQNLRALTVINISNNESANGSSQPCLPHPWCESMEKMVETKSDFHTRTLLLSGVCKNLTYVVVTGRKRHVGSLFELLNNAPALKILHLTSYIASFKDLEMLHEKVPHLHSLLLTYIIFESTSCDNKIKPATALKSFHYISCNFGLSFNYNSHLQYIRQKYTHLEELELQIEPLDDDDDNMRDLMQEQRAMMTSYLTTLGAHLKILSLNIESFNGDICSSGFSFNLLDECGCRIETLNLGCTIDIPSLYQLSSTSQVKYITALTVNEIVLEDSYVVFKWIRDFIALKNLSLHTLFSWKVLERMTLNLSQLLETQLETLLIEFVHLIFDGDDSTKIPVYPSLRNLTLSRITFEPGTDVFISTMFPNLKHLTLNYCFTRSDSFTLPKTNLSYLEIKNVNGPFPIMVITLGNNQRRLYYTSTDMFHVFDTDIQRDMFALPSVSSQPADNSEVTPLLTITCHSVYDFFMVNEWR